MAELVIERGGSQRCKYDSVCEVLREQGALYFTELVSRQNGKHREPFKLERDHPVYSGNCLFSCPKSS